MGSAKYVEAHKSELDKISGILVHDTGTGRVLTLGLHDNYQDREIVDQEIAPLRELKLLEPVVKRLGRSATLHRVEGADHSFHVPVRSGRNDVEVMREILDAFSDWAGTIGAK